MHGRHPLRFDHFRQVQRIAVSLGAGHDQRRADGQRPEELPDRHVETGRGLLQHPVAGGQPVLVLHPQQPVDDARVRDDDSLGLSGRTGGVDHIRRRPRIDRATTGQAVRPARIPLAQAVHTGAVHRGAVHGETVRGRAVHGVAVGAGAVHGGDDGGIVEFQHGHGRLRQGGADRRRGHQAGRVGVGEHERNPVGRVVRVDRQVGGARPVYREQGDDKLRRARHRQRDDPFRPCTLPGQHPRQPPRPRVQLRVGQLRAGRPRVGRLPVGRPRVGRLPVGRPRIGRLCAVRPRAVRPRAGQLHIGRWCAGQRRAVADHRDRVRGARGLRAYQVQQSRRLVDRVGGVVPVPQDPIPLERAEHVQPADRLVGTGHHLAEQRGEPGPDPLDGGAVEQVGAVLDPADDPVAVRRLDKGEGQVELGRVLAERLRPGRQVQQRRPVPGTGQIDDHDLEERMARERPGRVDRIHHPLERHVLVVEGGQVGLAHPGQQLAEGGIARRVGPQHQRVEEEAHQIVERLVTAAGGRGAQRDVAPCPEAGEQHRDRGLQHHEHADVARPGELAQTARELRVQREVDHSPAGGRLGRTRPVQRQRQLARRAGERLPPEGELAGQQAVRVGGVTEDSTLPQRVVGVLHR